MKRFLGMLLIVALILCFSSCGKSPDSNDVSPSVPASGEPTANENISSSKPDEEASSDAVSDPWIGHDTDELSYEFTDGVLYIRGNGPMRDYFSDYPAWNEYEETAEKIVIEEGVTTVGQFAFSYFANVSKVSLPSTLEGIGEYAFNYCMSLQEVNLPDSITYIGGSAFYNTMINHTGDFILPENLEYLGNEAFHSAIKGGKVIIPASLEYIGVCAFSNGLAESFEVDGGNPSYVSEDGVLFSKDKSVIIQFPYDETKTDYVIPDGVEQIEPQCFNVSDSLKTLTIGPDVRLIAEDAIFYNYGLTDIFVDEANKSFKSSDGVLFSADGKHLIAFPEGKPADGYAVPEGTERISSWTFPVRGDMTSITIPESLKSIGESAFIYDDRLESIYLPAGLESIEPYAFDGCGSLTSVYFGGTEDQWKALDADRESNAPLFNAEINFESDGDH